MNRDVLLLIASLQGRAFSSKPCLSHQFDPSTLSIIGHRVRHIITLLSYPLIFPQSTLGANFDCYAPQNFQASYVVKTHKPFHSLFNIFPSNTNVIRTSSATGIGSSVPFASHAETFSSNRNVIPTSYATGAGSNVAFISHADT